MIITTTGPRRRVRAATAVLAVAGAGCSSFTEAPTSTPSATAAAPSSTEDAEAAEARADALAAYNSYREAQLAAMATSDVSGGDLRRYTADPLLTQIRLTLQQHQQQGLINAGTPSWSPQATQVNVSSRPFTVQIEDCFDHGNWRVVRKSTGEAVSAPGQSTRYPVVAKAVLYDDGRWLIQTAQAQRERRC
ncbi:MULTISPECIES: hypothetical protein [unclassified Micromonospora]|uniref:hypothetical protein n=1 Tax=unclassified Micromonospora TaxID=2617518 RepID=UPI0033B4E71E